MPAVNPASLDIATLAWLTGSAANDYLLERLHRIGHQGVRTSHGYVIQHLIDGGPTVTELAAHLGVTQQAASKYVRELEGLGYVQRAADADDARVRRLSLTERGHELVADSRQARTELESALVERAGAGAVTQAGTVLSHLLDLVHGTDGVTRRATRPPQA